MVETRSPDASTRHRLLVEALEAYALAGGCAADRQPDYCYVATGVRRASLRE